MPPSKNISFDELSKYFHLPINQVAKELGVCATILKKICRRNGIPRWPHRKIKSLDKMISNLNMNLDKNPAEREDIIREIELLKAKKTEIMNNPELLAKGSHTNLGESFLARPVTNKAPKNKLPRADEPYTTNINAFREIVRADETDQRSLSAPPQPTYYQSPTHNTLKRETDNTVKGTGFEPYVANRPRSFDLPLPQNPSSYNFMFPPLDYNYTAGQDLPSFRFVGEQTPQHVQPYRYPPLDPLRYAPATPQMNTAMLPSWFAEEKDRVLSKLQ